MPQMRLKAVTVLRVIPAIIEDMSRSVNKEIVKKGSRGRTFAAPLAEAQVFEGCAKAVIILAREKFPPDPSLFIVRS